MAQVLTFCLCVRGVIYLYCSTWQTIFSANCLLAHKALSASTHAGRDTRGRYVRLQAQARPRRGATSKYFRIMVFEQLSICLGAILSTGAFMLTIIDGCIKLG